MMRRFILGLVLSVLVSQSMAVEPLSVSATDTSMFKGTGVVDMEERMFIVGDVYSAAWRTERARVAFTGGSTFFNRVAHHGATKQVEYLVESSATDFGIHTLFTGLKNVPNDFAKTNATGAPIIETNNKAI